MYYKDDWDQARQRLEAFWQGEVIDRCCVAVFAPRRGSQLPPFPELQHGPWLGGLEALADDDAEGITRWWTDPEANYQRAVTWFENTWFGGEAIPATYVNWGASAGAGFFGSPPQFRKTTVWYPKVIADWDTWQWEFDAAANRWWRTIWDITAYLTERAEGRYFVGLPEFGNAADNLSLMRGMDDLAVDCLEEPERIAEAIDFMDAWWVKLHEPLYQLTLAANQGGGVLPWMSLWAPGRIDQLACDFSSLLSPDTFRDVFVRDIERMGAWMDYGMYHLDGPACMRHMLDPLLEINCVKAIEFTPGIGAPPTLTAEYLPRYRRIQQSGRRLYLLAQPHEIEPLLEELSPRGLYLCTQTDTQDAAEDLLAQVTRWSAAALRREGR